MDGTVLIADDDRTIRTVLTQAMTRAGCRVHATASLDQLMRWIDEGRGDLVITDVMMPDGNGIDLIPQIHRARPDLPVIVISARNTIVTAIRASEADAFDYLPKPFDLHELIARARKALLQGHRKTDTRRGDGAAGAAQISGAAFHEDDRSIPLIGQAPAMQKLFRKVARVLNTDLAVMIAGQSGVGRSLLARMLHELSDRAGAGFAVLTAADCSEAAIGRAVDQAQGGTLVIEDPAGMDLSAQARLIGLIESWEIGLDHTAPRLVSTTAPSPQEGIAQGRLRADLYYRLAGMVLTVPPLMARIDDIPALARHFLTRAARQGLPVRRLGDGAAALIRAHHFPGNLRELDNLMRGLALSASGEEITEAEVQTALAELAPTPLPLDEEGTQNARGPMQARALTDPLEPGAHGDVPSGTIAPSRLSQSVEIQLQRYFDLHGDQLPPPGLYPRILQEVERPLLQIALDATGGNQLRCAELLGMNRNTLRKKLTELKIEVTRRRKLM